MHRVLLLALLELRTAWRRPSVWMLLAIVLFLTWGFSTGSVVIGTGGSSTGAERAWLNSQFNLAFGDALVFTLFYCFFACAIFGGAVNARYLVSEFSNDDNFDYDQGYRGNLQFLFAIQTDIGDDRGDRGFEMDGATAPEATATPLGGGTVLNATLIGIGDAVQPNGQAGRPSTAMHLRDNGATKIYNSVFVEFANLAVVDADEQPRIDAGDLQFRNNTFWSHIAGNNTVANAFEATSPLKPAFFTDTAFGNKIENPQLRGISRKAERKLDPRPAAGSPLLGAAVTAPPNAFFTATTYRGAFGDTNWAAGWTKLWTEGWFDLASAGGAAGDTPIIAGSANKFINISTTGFAGTGAQVLTAGFVIPAGQTQTVLIRGVEGLHGPGRVTKQLGIDRRLNRTPAEPASGLWLEDRGVVVPRRAITATPRIGVDYAGVVWARKPWRFVLADPGALPKAKVRN